MPGRVVALSTDDHRTAFCSVTAAGGAPTSPQLRSGFIQARRYSEARSPAAVGR